MLREHTVQIRAHEATRTFKTSERIDGVNLRRVGKDCYHLKL
jgi:hypothetical protein